MDALKDVLFTLFRKTPHHDSWVIACLEGAWSGILGEGIARICRPLKLLHGELVIEVLDPAWKPALSGMKAELARRLRSASGGAVTGVKFRLPGGTAGPGRALPAGEGED